MTRLASIIDVNAMLNVAQRRCDDFGISVKYDHHAKTAMSNGHTITLPTIKQPITQDKVDTMYGFIIHECGHHVRDDAFKILNSAQPPPHVCNLFNIVEDDGMERERANEWRGDKKALSNLNTILVDQVAVSWENAIAQGLVKENQPAEPLAAMCMGRLSSLDWDHSNDVVTERILNSMPEQVKALVTELVDEGWVDKLRGTDTPDKAWDVTIDLVKRLYPDHDEDQLEEMRQDGHNKSDPNQQDRDKSKDQNEKGETKGDDADGDGEQGEVQGTLEGGERSEDGRIISWKDVVLSEHNQWEANDKTPGGFGIDFSGMVDTNGVCLMPTNLVNVVDLAKEEGKNKQQRWRSPEAEDYLPSDASSKAFANRVRRYIQAQARSVVEREKYHGKLDKSAIVRLALPPIDGGEYNKRIFYDQRKHTMKDTAIFVLTDWSGSMCGPKMEYAADASQRLVHTFDRVLNVPVALAAFSNGETRCDIGYIKKFNTRGTTPQAIAERFAAFYHYSSSNNDADSLNWAWHEILKRKETRKLLIVLSDGCPAGAWKQGYGVANLQHVAKTIEKDGRVELYGVGICSSAVEDYYTNTKVLNDPDEINSTLFNIIKEGNNAKHRRR